MEGSEDLTPAELTDEQREKAAGERTQRAYNTIASKIGHQALLPNQWEAAATTKLLIELGIFSKAVLLEAVADQAESTALQVMRQALTAGVAESIAAGRAREVH